MTSEGTKNDEDMILDQVTWYRWFLSLLMGPIWGILGLKGLFAIALYGCSIALFALAVVNKHGHGFILDFYFWGLATYTYLYLAKAFSLKVNAYVGKTVIRTDALEKVGGSSLVIKEGGLSAFAAFTVTWIITFTLINS